MSKVKVVTHKIGNLDAFLYKSCRKEALVLKIVLLEELQRLWFLFALAIKSSCEKYDYVNRLSDLMKHVKYTNEQLKVVPFNDKRKVTNRCTKATIEAFIKKYKDSSILKLNDTMISRMEELSLKNNEKIVDIQSAHIKSSFRKINNDYIAANSAYEKMISSDDYSSISSEVTFKPFMPLMNINFITNISDFKSISTEWQLLMTVAKTYQNVLITPPNDSKEFSVAINSYFKNLERSKDFAKCSTLKKMIKVYTARLSDQYSKYFSESVNEGNTNNIVTKFIDDLTANVNMNGSEFERKKLFSEIGIINSIFKEKFKKELDTEIEGADNIFDMISSLSSGEKDLIEVNGQVYNMNEDDKE